MRDQKERVKMLKINEFNIPVWPQDWWLQVSRKMNTGDWRVDGKCDICNKIMEGLQLLENHHLLFWTIDHSFQTAYTHYFSCIMYYSSSNLLTMLQLHWLIIFFFELLNIPISDRCDLIFYSTLSTLSKSLINQLRENHRQVFSAHQT